MLFRSGGDEVQGLFKSTSATFLYFRLFKMLLSPLDVRCGIGIGEWDVRITNGTSAEQDGPAYHQARTAIVNAHDRNGYHVLFNSNHENDIILNTLANTSWLFTKRQSPYQNQVLLLVELMHPFFDNEAMNLLAFSDIFKLVQTKTERLYKNTKRTADNKHNMFNELTAADSEPFHIFSPTTLESRLTLATTLKKGLSTKISFITNTSRQNVDNVIKAAYIGEIRKIEAATLLLISKTFGR